MVDACATIPDGVLLFLPSYGLLDKLATRWKVGGWVGWWVGGMCVC